MKKLITLIILTLIVQSCGSVAAGIINRTYLEEDNETYVATELAHLTLLKLNEDQKNTIGKIFQDEIVYLKENAHREKIKEISNSASLNNIRYQWYKRQIEIEQVLTPDQVREYRTSKFDSYNDKDMAKEKAKLKKLGYKV